MLLILKIKGTDFTVHAMKARGGAEVKLHSFLTSLYTGNEPRFPLNKRLCGPQSRSERFVEVKILLPVLGFETRTI
jgi:hypothetical protein